MVFLLKRKVRYFICTMAMDIVFGRNSMRVDAKCPRYGQKLVGMIYSFPLFLAGFMSIHSKIGMNC